MAKSGDILIGEQVAVSRLDAIATGNKLAGVFASLERNAIAVRKILEPPRIASVSIKSVSIKSV